MKIISPLEAHKVPSYLVKGSTSVKNDKLCGWIDYTWGNRTTQTKAMCSFFRETVPLKAKKSMFSNENNGPAPTWQYHAS